jgi:hypothetical protein
MVIWLSVLGLTSNFQYKQDNGIVCKKKGAYSFIQQYPTGALECILVYLSVSRGIVSLQFDLLVNNKIFYWHEEILQ